MEMISTFALLNRVDREPNPHLYAFLLQPEMILT